MGLRLDGRLAEQTADEVLRSHRAVAHRVLEAVAFLLYNQTQQGTRRGEGSVEVVVIVDGQQVVITRINVGDEEGQAAQLVQALNGRVEIVESLCRFVSLDRPPSEFSVKLSE